MSSAKRCIERAGVLSQHLLSMAGFMGALGLAAASTSALAVTTVTRTTIFDYEPSSGILTREVVEPFDSELCLVTAYTIDPYGHRTESTTRNCAGQAGQTPGTPAEAAAPAANSLAAFTSRTTKEAYTADQLFVLTLTNALGHVETKDYDTRLGVVKTLTGPNQLATNWVYDAFGRKTAEKRADGTGTRWEYKYCTGFFGGNEACPTIAGAVAVYTITTTPLKAPFDINAAQSAAPNGPYVKVYFDAQDREVRSETQGPDLSGSSQLIYRDTEYDNKGRVAKKSQPYFAGASTIYWQSYTHDELNRVLTTTETTGAGTATRSVTYNGLETLSLDPLNHQTIERRDASGAVVTVTDHYGSVLQRSFDPYGNLVSTVDAKGNVTSMTYDTRGRRKKLYDPDLGVWSYAYNAVGELVQQVDAKSQTTSTTYDKLGRVQTRTEPDGSSQWYYDTTYFDGSACNKGVGKLCEVRSANGYSAKTLYDNVGRATSTSTTVGSVYTSTILYDANTGKPTTLTYPSGLQVRNDYTTGLGYLRSVTDLRTNVVLWTANSVDAAGRLLQYTYGNGVVTTNDYFPEGHLNSTRAAATGGALHQLLSHTYDLAGNLKTRFDLYSTVTANYDYDNLNRLTKETRAGGGVSPAQEISWAYDAIGNMTQRSESGTTNVYNYPSSGAGSALPHAVASISGFVNGYAVPIYKYDANGNLTSGGQRSVSWNSFDKVQSITRGSARLDYLYDAAHERVQELYYVNGSVQRRTVYLNPGAGAGLYYEEETGAAGTKIKHYISGGAGTVAVIVCQAAPCTNAANTSTQYWHVDHLGSVSVTTNEAGAVVERLAYEPFGKRRNANGVTDTNGTLVASSTDRGYTGHEHMDEVGLINMNGRVFDPALGRFMSADPFIQNPTGLQSFNRYSYGWNSPLNGADPTGYSWASKTWQKAWHNDNIQALVTIAIAYYVGPGAAAEYAGARTYYETRSIGQGLKAAALTWITAEGNYAIGTLTQFAGGELLNIAAHAAWGCATSKAGGGTCRSGAWAGGVSSAFSVLGGDKAIESLPIEGRVLVHSIIGGTASKLGGGKFANGAITGGFAYLFNSLTHPDYKDSSLVNGIRQAIIRGDVEELRLLLGNAAELSSTDLAIAQRALTAMESLGPEGAKLLASRYGVNFANTVNHAFGQAKHNLGPLVQEFGSPAQAFVQVQTAVDAAFATTGNIPAAVQVGRFTVQVRGAIMDGVAHIRTLFIPK